MKNKSTFTIIPVPVSQEFACITSSQLIIHNAIFVILISIAFVLGTIAGPHVISFILGNAIGSLVLFLVCRVKNMERFSWEQILKIVASVEKIKK